MPHQPWEVLADVLLQREALLCRLGRGVPPRDLAGWFVRDEDVERILRTLPGLDGPSPEEAAPLREELDATVLAARDAFAASLDDGSAFSRLVGRARLRLPEAEALGLVAAVELHPPRQRLAAYVQDSVQLPRLTLATMDRLFPGAESGSRLVSPDGALRRAEIVEVDLQGPWAVRMCALPSRVAWLLRGDGSPDPALPPGAVVVGSSGSSVRATSAVLLVHGADRMTRLRTIGDRSPSRSLLVTAPPDSPAGWAAVVREATIAGAVVVLETVGGLDVRARAAMERASHLSWSVSSVAELPLDTLPGLPFTEVRLVDGTADEQDWQHQTGQRRRSAYRLDREQLRLVASTLNGDPTAVGRGVRRLAAGHLDQLALRVTPTRGWDDLALPRDQKSQLEELAARCRRRDRVYDEWGFPPLPSSGVVALFAGASGTGKTLAAEVIAGELGLDLYKVDLASVVSKYIGETEKNLGRIFDAAGAGDLVLFFDEADALFGKRTEISDARDRYANIEVSYLLQRLERHAGLVVLATNLQRNIDQAFLRRIAVAVDFPVPDQAQRRAIWLRAFPASAPVVDLDLDFLARNFKISGGVIHNASLGAAFLAADDGQVITMDHVALALKREFQKLGRLRTEAEFDRYYELVNRDDDAEPPR